ARPAAARRAGAGRRARTERDQRAGALPPRRSNVTTVRIAAIASHPVQYQAPWYRALAQLADLRVFFAHRASAEEQGRAGFEVPFEWDVPLVDGYAYEWLTNMSSRPGVGTFLGCDTPAIADRLAAGRFDAVVVNGWQLLTYWQAIRAARALGVPVL